MKTKTLFLTLSLAALGCGGAPTGAPDDTNNSTTGGSTTGSSTTGSSTTGSSTTGGDTTGGGTTTSSPDGPSILSLGTDVGRITTGGTVRFVAVVTHPAGLDKLVGGKLVDETDQINYGAFIASTQGSYQIELTWDQINKTSSIDFDAEINRLFVAEFYDQAGNVSTSSLDVGLYCHDHLGACGGVCTDVATDKNNCGACGNKLADGLVCIGGKVQCESGGGDYCDGKCVDTNNDDNNCGGCGIVVTAPAYCQRGVPTCWSGGYCADTNSCVDLQSDPNNCGACGLVAPAGSVCTGGVPVCPMGTLYCAASNTCTPPGQDVNNCGACGHVCVAPSGTTASCEDGSCRYAGQFTTPGSSCFQFCHDKGLGCPALGPAEAHYTNHDPISLTCNDGPAESLGAGQSFTFADCTCS